MTFCVSFCFSVGCCWYKEGTKKEHRRQEEGAKNECVVFVMKKPISKKKIAESRRMTASASIRALDEVCGIDATRTVDIYGRGPRRNVAGLAVSLLDSTVMPL